MKLAFVMPPDPGIAEYMAEQAEPCAHECPTGTKCGHDCCYRKWQSCMYCKQLDPRYDDLPHVSHQCEEFYEFLLTYAKHGFEIGFPPQSAILRMPQYLHMYSWPMDMQIPPQFMESPGHSTRMCVNNRNQALYAKLEAARKDHNHISVSPVTAPAL